MSRYFLGVDGGQSSTTALIGDQSGSVLGSGAAGPCNHVKSGGGREKFISAVGGCIAAACRRAGLDQQELRFESACLGFSGGPDDKRALVVEIVPAARHFVTTDAWIALSGATAGGPGIITMAGTGSISFGRNAAGVTARAGGWGYIYGDEGGAFDIVRQAVRALLRAEEGWGPVTSLRRKLLGATGAASANQLLHMLYTSDFPRDRVAGFATLVDEAVLEGDAVARQIVYGAAQQLASITAAVREQLFHEGEPVRVAFAGGAFRNTLLAERFRDLVEMDVDCRCGPPLHKPVMGALIEAWKASGVQPAGR
ncbi:MAG: ATPase [Bryobacterales bacterium]|nr:ATPase [Bryobacterales bacterium]